MSLDRLSRLLSLEAAGPAWYAGEGPLGTAGAGLKPAPTCSCTLSWEWEIWSPSPLGDPTRPCWNALSLVTMVTSTRRCPEAQ